ncbi:MAG: hypothetical protein ACR2GL_00985 [Thermoleophilaceae bacterium]
MAPTLLAAALAVVYLIVKPRSPDLAAHIFRSELFGREGFTIWNGQWYGGHHTPAYSILSPPLGWLLGPQLMGAFAAVGATVCFTELARGHFGPSAARFGTIWFGAGSATLLATNRLPFALGIAFGVAAALALQRRRRVLAPALGVLAAISSPVAGLFLTMCAAGYALASVRGRAARSGITPIGAVRERRTRRLDAFALGASGIGPPVLLTIAFPEGGYAPFPFSSYIAIPLFVLVALLVLPREERTLRVTAVLYALGSTAAVVVPTAMGGNAVRFGALFGGPVLACALAGRWRRPVVPVAALLAALLVWQWSPAVRDLYKAATDPVAKASYFDPVREYLRLLPDQRRVEIPFTLGHWEGAEVAVEAPLARGWLRQLDTGRNEIFYGGVLNELTYASWLSENAVRYVALPDSKPDRSSYRERALIERGLPYLELRAEFDHWRIYEVTLPAPIVISKGDANITLDQLGSDELLLRVREPGEALIRVRWTPYWLAKGGCVERDGKWTRVTAEKEGFLRLVTRFSPERILQRGRRCNGV